MHPAEMTEAEQRALRDGLRLLARMIARRQLKRQAAEREPAAPVGNPGAARGAGQVEGASR